MSVHIVIRGSATAGGSQDLNADPIQEHNLLASQYQFALYGKVGRKPDTRRLKALRDSAECGKARLILVRKQEKKFVAWSAPLTSVHDDDFVPDLRRVPKYYHHLATSVTVWFEIGVFDLLSSHELGGLVLLSNGRALIETLAACRTSLMLVRPEKEGASS